MTRLYIKLGAAEPSSPQRSHEPIASPRREPNAVPAEILRNLRAPNLRQILFGTLRQLQESLALNPSDPALLELKASILRTIADLEIQKNQRPIW